MYIPQHFREDDLATLQTFIQDHPFATLITQLENRSVASHLPLTFQPQQGPYGTFLVMSRWETSSGKPLMALMKRLLSFKVPMPISLLPCMRTPQKVFQPGIMLWFMPTG